MKAIRIRRTIESDVLQLPELRPFLGHTVDILIEDCCGQTALSGEAIPGTGDWQTFREAAAALRDSYDFAAVREQDACNMQDAQNRLLPALRLFHEPP